MKLARDEWIYDWNSPERPAGGAALPARRVELDDETLRDGLQSPSARNPPLQAKRDFLHVLVKTGIDSVDIGLPASGSHVFEDTLFLAREIAKAKLPLSANCAARTVKGDVHAIVDISQKAGIPIEVATFIGSSAVRQYAEGWDLEFLLKSTREAIGEVKKAGLPAMYVTEDTTRAHPEVLRQLYTAAIEHGARRICIADTVGFATPEGARRIVTFLRQVIAETGEDVKIDWHGHMDRGLAVSATLAAMEAGADRLHGSALGIGERVGNTPLDLIIVNLKMMGRLERDLTPLKDYVEWVARWAGVPIPWNYPIFGKDAYRTGTGIHAAAIVKALNMGDESLVDLVYASVPASWVGKQQVIEVGPMSGESNVCFWLKKHGEKVTARKVEEITRHAKAADHTLSDDEIRDVLERIEKA
jgi:2-isopropylmalate synthase